MEKTMLFAMSAQDYFNWQNPVPDFSEEPEAQNMFDETTPETTIAAVEEEKPPNTLSEELPTSKC
jgi:hypothetical protein